MTEVPIYRVADILGSRDILVCKIDVEGAEPAVLRGMEERLDSISHPVVECNPAGLMAAGSSADCIVEELERNAFSST